MIPASEIARSLYGAGRLARFDAGGMQFFENTLDGFWRSFFAAVIVAPMFTALAVIHLWEVPATGGPVRVLFVETISYVLDWLIFPFVAIYIADFLGKGDRYLRYIAARNWAIVLQMVLFLIIALLSLTGLLDRSTMVTISIAATIAILIYQGFITRVGLDVSIRAAAAIVFLDLVLGVILNATTNRMIQ
jgi:hypothetical protein